MKKFIATVMVLCMVLALAGCSKKSANIITGYKSGDVTLGQYKGLTYTPMVINVTEEDVDTRVNSFVAAHAETVEITDRTDVQEGDIANIDYCGKKDGVAFEGGTDTGFDLTIGSHQFIDGFEEGLIGKKVGETVTLDLTFPEEYHSEDLAGQAVQFEVTVNSISEEVLPELTDELVADNTECKTIAEYREQIRAEMTAELESNAAADKSNQVIQKAIDNATFNKNLDSEIEDAMNDMISQADAMYQQYYGVDAATVYGALYGMDATAFHDYMYASAESNTKFAYLASAIAEAENCTAEDSEIEELASSMLATYGYTSTQELYVALKGIYNIDGREVVGEQVKLNKAANIIDETSVAE